MKLNPLPATTRRPAPEPTREPVHDPRWHVGAVDAVQDDRGRSLQQELAEVDPRATGPFEGRHKVESHAREVAATLRTLGPQAGKLLRLAVHLPAVSVDTEA